MKLARKFSCVKDLPDRSLLGAIDAPPKPKKIEAESEPVVLPDGEPEDGDEPVTGELVAEVLYDPKKGGVIEADEGDCNDEYADSGAVWHLVDLFNMAVRESSRFREFYEMTAILSGWITDLTKKGEDREQ